MTDAAFYFIVGALIGMVVGSVLMAVYEICFEGARLRW